MTKFCNRLFSSIFVVASSLLSTGGYAATQPTSITEFSGANPGPAVFSVSPRGWRDPAFGNMGWTHSSQWGQFNAKKGQIVTISITSQAAGLHPGCTVWRRDRLNTADVSYVPDHFYSQSDGMHKWGATDEATGENLGAIIMPIVAWGYDKDDNINTFSRKHRITDGTPGTLGLTFTAPARALYQFVVAGFNPDSGIDPAVKKFNMEVTVTITNPE